MKIKFKWIDIVIIILFLLSVYFILTRIFGHSATDLTIMISLFTFLGGVVFRLTYFVFDFNKDFGEFKVKTMNSFGKLKNDTNLIQDDIDLIKSKLNIK